MSDSKSFLRQIPDLPQSVIDQIPTFDQFVRDPDKFRASVSWQKKFELVDQAGNLLKNQLRRVGYEICGYKCETLEEVERVARAEGVNLDQIDFHPEIIPDAGHKCDIIVRFVIKERL